MSDYYPSPDELRDAWINDYDAGMPMEEDSVRGSETVEANTLEGQMSVAARNYNIAKIGSPEWRRDPDKYTLGPDCDTGCLDQGIRVCEHDTPENDDRIKATCEWFDSLPKPPEPLPWIEAPKATDRHPFD